MTILVGALALAQISMAAGTAQEAEWNAALQQARQEESGGRYPEALAAYRKAAALADRFGKGDMRTWTSYNALAIIYAEIGQPAESARTYRRALAMVKATMGEQNLAYARILGNLGTLYIGQNDFASAENILTRALRIATGLANPNAVQVATVRVRMAEVFANRHRWADADEMIRLALGPLRSAGELAETAMALNCLGSVRRSQHRYRESLDLIAQAVAAMEKSFGPEHPMLLRDLCNLARAYELAGNREMADATFRRAKAICETSLPPGHPSHARLLANYAVFLRRIGEKAEAKAMQKEATSLARADGLDGAGLTLDVSGFRQN